MLPLVDGYKLVIKTRPPDGVPVVRTFFDRRLGISWPTAGSPAYFCLFGMEDRLTIYGKTRPLVLLAEGTDQRAEGRMPRRAFFGKVIAASHRFKAAWAICDMRPQWDILLWGLSEVLTKRNVDLTAYDSSEWGDLESMRASVDEMGQRGLPDIPERSILSGELRRLTPDSMRTQDGMPAEERFPAVAAMSRVVTSWEIYPWRKPEKVKSKKKGEGYR